MECLTARLPRIICNWADRCSDVKIEGRHRDTVAGRADWHRHGHNRQIKPILSVRRIPHKYLRSFGGERRCRWCRVIITAAVLRFPNRRD